jgi:hypothetical protein
MIKSFKHKGLKHFFETGNRQGLWSISVNGDWRIILEFIETVYLETSGLSGRQLAVQDNYDLWHAKQTLNLSGLQPINFATA